LIEQISQSLTATSYRESHCISGNFKEQSKNLTEWAPVSARKLVVAAPLAYEHVATTAGPMPLPRRIASMPTMA